MSLTSSLWTSVSGLIAHSERMSTISNNISNVNTVAYKGARMDFSDFLYQSVGTTSGVAQVGMGTKIGTIMGDFSQGSLETTTSATDIAISGNGYFCVSPIGSTASYYTRAGNFSFNASGYLVDPNGYVLQGWAIDNSTVSSGGSGIVGSGAAVDIKLETFTCAPKHTTSTIWNLNLATDAVDNSTDASSTDPFFSLLNAWNATDTPPLSTSQYAYQTTMEVYDEAGNAHTLTIYFDPVISDVSDGSSGETYWEYIITMDPNDDVRDFASAVGDVTTNPNVPDELKGLLGAGTITFDSTGTMVDMTCFVPDGGTTGSWWTSGTPPTVDLNSWVAAPIGSDGYPVICPNFSGSAGLSNAYASGDYTQPNRYASGRLVSLNFGLGTTSGSWDFSNVSSPSGAGGLVSAADIGTQKVNITGFGNKARTESSAISNMGTNYYESRLSQDGYTYGDLRTVFVSSNGVLSATYSNGVSLELYQITLYNFASEQGLRREGNNLFSETAASGIPTSGAAGTGTFGTTEGYALEQSNVDLSREFVNMITTQRGFQANSKNITTVDTMLETVIGMKR